MQIFESVKSALSLFSSENQRQDTSSWSEDAHNQSEASSEQQLQQDISSTVRDFEEKVNEMKQ